MRILRLFVVCQEWLDILDLMAHTNTESLEISGNDTTVMTLFDSGSFNKARLPKDVPPGNIDDICMSGKPNIWSLVLYVFLLE